MSFILQKRTMGFKIESTPYTAEASVDWNIPFEDITYDPDLKQMSRKVARGHYSKVDPSITGKRLFKFGMKVALAYSGTAATPPSYFPVLRACGMKQVIATGVTLTPHADYSNVPATVWINERDEGTAPSVLQFKLRGCMGNPTIELNNVGEPVYIKFDFQGVLVSIADVAFASIINPSAFDATLPDALLGATLKAFAEVQTANKVTINLNNKIELFTDPSAAEGVQGAHIVDRDPTIAMDPDLALIATQGDYSRLTGNSTGTFSMTIGSHITLSTVSLQLNKAYKPGNREGHVTNEKEYSLRGTVGNDEFSIVQA